MKEFSMTNCQRHSIKPNFSVPKGLASTSQGHPLCAHKPLCPTSRALALLPLGVITLTGAFRGSLLSLPSSQVQCVDIYFPSCRNITHLREN